MVRTMIANIASTGLFENHKVQSFPGFGFEGAFLAKCLVLTASSLQVEGRKTGESEALSEPCKKGEKCNLDEQRPKVRSGAPECWTVSPTIPRCRAQSLPLARSAWSPIAAPWMDSQPSAPL